MIARWVLAHCQADSVGMRSVVGCARSSVSLDDAFINCTIPSIFVSILNHCSLSRYVHVSVESKRRLAYRILLISRSILSTNHLVRIGCNREIIMIGV